MFGENDAQSNQLEDSIWQTYLNAAKPENEARPKNWEESTTGILTFTGLFAATVPDFIVESYKVLSVDSGDQSAILSQLLAPSLPTRRSSV